MTKATRERVRDQGHVCRCVHVRRHMCMPAHMHACVCLGVCPAGVKGWGGGGRGGGVSPATVGPRASRQLPLGGGGRASVWGGCLLEAACASMLVAGFGIWGDPGLAQSRGLPAPPPPYPRHLRVAGLIKAVESITSLLKSLLRPLPCYGPR